MKTLKIISFIGGIIMCAFLSGCINTKINIENTKRFSFSYSVGYYMDAYYLYQLDLNNNKYIASYKGAGISEENKLIKEVEKKDVLKLEKILTDHQIYKWNGFNKVDKRVLDGNNFSLYYKNTDDKTIEASGYMKYPKGYKTFKEEIDNYFNKLFQEEIKNQKQTSG